MKNTLYLTIFGLNSDTSDQLKSAIQNAFPQGTLLEWTTLAHPELDFIFINDAFFHSQIIQNIISTHKHIKYLRLVNSPEKSGIINNGILYYPFLKSNDLLSWLVDKTKNYQINLNHEATLSFDEIFTERNGFIRLYDHIGNIAIIDARTERVFVDPKRDHIIFNHQIKQSYAKSSLVNELLKSFILFDLKVWLWQVLYQSTEILELSNIQDKQCYILNEWPQVNGFSNRKKLLKISAFFSKGAEVEYVVQNSEYTSAQVKKFILMTQLLRMSESIPPAQAKFKIETVQSYQNSSGVFSSFLGKLRRKLGI